VTVAVRIKGRPWVSVLADMIDGVILSNSLSGPTAGAARAVMWAAVEADVVRGTALHEGAGVPKQRTGSRSGQSVRRRGPQPAGQPQARVA